MRGRQDEADAILVDLWFGAFEVPLDEVTSFTWDEDKLKLYGLYKQAKEGDNTTGAPWSIQWETKAKWEAWEKCKGKSKETAMTEYIAEVEAQKEKFGIEPP
eukprot:g21382.t1